MAEESSPLDGIRCITIRSGKQLRLLSRNDLSLNARYPETRHGRLRHPRFLGLRFDNSPQAVVREE